MNAFEKFEAMGLQVGWKTALVGWNGPVNNERQIDEKQIIDLATRYISQSSKIADEVITLATLSPREVNKIGSLLEILASKEGGSVDLEIRKWRLLLLQNCLINLPEDPLYAWLAIAEFWRTFDFPEDSPLSFQKFDYTDSIDGGYSESFREELKRSHSRWLENEIETLKQSRQE